MTLLVTCCCILALVLLIGPAGLNPFLAFLVVSIATGLCLGISVDAIVRSVQKGIGDTLGSLVAVIVLGAMLGKLVAESGAAQRISQVLISSFGEQRVHWALMVTGFVVGVPLFYNVGFVLLVPLIFTIVHRLRLPAVYVAVPMLAALSVTHGFLPPHPSPSALVGQFSADMGRTLLYGILVSIPSILLAGPVFARTLKKMDAKPIETFLPRLLPDEQLPGTFVSFSASLLPVAVLAVTTLLPMMVAMPATATKVLIFFSEPAVVMLLALSFATYALGLGSGMTMKSIMSGYAEAVKDVALILLIVSGAGGLKQVFTDSGASSSIAAVMGSLPLSPLVQGWLMAAIIRVAMGSATVAGLTTAGIIAPVVATSGVDPSLMVLSIGAGSLMFSHVNDSGFWMFKEYFNLSIRDTIRSWSLMETIVSVTGLFSVLLLDMLLK
ncbi:MAG: gluconate transporter [Bacteroidetes bacterium]|nr:gluconate transporter [Bacteroidota bacterium]